MASLSEHAGGLNENKQVVKKRFTVQLSNIKTRVTQNAPYCILLKGHGKMLQIIKTGEVFNEVPRKLDYLILVHVFISL